MNKKLLIFMWIGIIALFCLGINAMKYIDNNLPRFIVWACTFATIPIGLILIYTASRMYPSRNKRDKIWFRVTLFLVIISMIAGFILAKPPCVLGGMMIMAFCPIIIFAVSGTAWLILKYFEK